ncbi:MAG: hypothetical protein Q8M03_12975 [Legionella sp.]|nr:hypothetical protein [Legionella sp.]
MKEATKNIDKRIREFQTKANDIDALPQGMRLMLQKQLKYSQLMEQIETDFAKYDVVIKPPFSHDAVLMQQVEKLNTHKDSYNKLFDALNNRILGATVTEKEELYDEAISALELFHSQYETLADEVNTRHQLLIKTSVDYTEKYKKLKDTVEQARVLIDKTAEASNPDISKARDQLRSQLEELERIPKTDSKLPMQERLEIKGALSQKSNDALSGLVLKLHTLLNEENEKTLKALNEENEKTLKAITTQKEFFVSLKATLLEKLNSYDISSKKLDKINQQTKKLLKSPALSLNEQLEQWENINQKFIEVQRAVEAQICNQLIGKSKVISEAMEKNAAKINKEIEAISATLNADELKLLESLKFEPTLPNFAEIQGSSELLQKNLDDLKRQQSELNANIGSARELINRHNRAKATVGSFNSFINEINTIAKGSQIESDRGIEILQSVQQLNEAELVKKIDENISKFTPQARLLLPRFIKKDKSARENLTDKMVFCNLLQAHKIDFTEYVKKSALIKTILSLNEVAKDQDPLSEWLTIALEKDNGFLHALNILDVNKIPLSREIVKTLAKDSDKCAVIIQQNTLNKEKNKDATPFDEKQLNRKEFTALLSYIIAADSKHMQVMHAVGQADKKFCQPSLLVYAEQSKELLDILDNNENRESNIAILKGMLGSTQQMARITFDYLSEKPTRKAEAKAYINRFFTKVPDKVNPESNIVERSLKHGLDRLLAINLNPSENAVVKLVKVAKVATAIQNFMLQHNFHVDGVDTNPDNELKKQEALSFQRKATPILLQAQPFLQRKEELSNLARQEITHRHKYVRLLGDVLQLITGAFLLIMPARLLMGKTALFSTAPTDRQAEMEQHIDEAEEKGGPAL